MGADMTRMPPIPEIRPLKPTDSLAELTVFLHRAYRPLADRGMRFLATYQDEKTTLERTQNGECYLAFLSNALAGTATLYPENQTKGSPWYDRPDVASFGQFAVEPAFQGRGLGSHILAFIEARARARGTAELALDTAEPATTLIAFYAARGYRLIENVQWEMANYRSVIMSKTLGPV